MTRLNPTILEAMKVVVEEAKENNWPLETVFEKVLLMAEAYEVIYEPVQERMEQVSYLLKMLKED